jgi:hypothetical protein
MGIFADKLNKLKSNTEQEEPRTIVLSYEKLFKGLVL